MAAGIIMGFAATRSGMDWLVIDWIKPIGMVFVRLLKMIAAPMIISSMIVGISNLRSISQLSKIGLRTAILYVSTTVVAIIIGLTVANLIRPGERMDESTRSTLVGIYQDDTAKKVEAADGEKTSSPLQPLVDLVPENVFQASTENRSMLQIIFAAVLFGVAMHLVAPEHQAPIQTLFTSLNAVVLRVVDLAMLCAPLGVFSLLATLVVEVKSIDLLVGLAWYGGCAFIGFAVMMIALYPLLAAALTSTGYREFFQAMIPAQLLAFSTSSSAATLPLTIDRVEGHLGVDKEISSFVLPVGATVNMDGTSLYQAVSAVFIAQAFGIDLDIQQQLTIVLTATLASIGSAGVPGAGIVMLVIVLGAIGVPEEGIALIFAVERILDMMRTSVNVTGDALVCLLVAKAFPTLASEQK